IELMVRGICALRPGIRGVSDRIRVRSLVGRFLEHSRIFCFANGGDDEIYIGNADWMPRNLYEPVEVIVPIPGPMVRERVMHEILDSYLADNMKTRVLQRDGTYERIWRTGKRPSRAPVGAAAFNAQEFLIGLAEGKSSLAEIPALPSRAVRKPRTLAG